MKPNKETLKSNMLTTFIKGIYKKVAVYFEPEEVEVTFDEAEKKNGTYTYTVVPHHKQVA